MVSTIKIGKIDGALTSIKMKDDAKVSDVLEKAGIEYSEEIELMDGNAKRLTLNSKIKTATRVIKVIFIVNNDKNGN